MLKNIGRNIRLYMLANFLFAFGTGLWLNFRPLYLADLGAAPKHPGGAPNCADWVMEEAYSHELSSAGFWPGAGLGEAAFYAYAYPEPDGFSEYNVKPEAAYYNKDLGEFILPYKAVRTADDPDKVLLDFFQSSYEAGANLAGWDRNKLEREAAQRMSDS